MLFPYANYALIKVIYHLYPLVGFPIAFDVCMLKTQQAKTMVLPYYINMEEMLMNEWEMPIIGLNALGGREVFKASRKSRL